MTSLTIAEAKARAALIQVTGYRIHLDLDQGEHTFGSTSTITFAASTPGESTFLDVKAHSVASISLNDKPVDVSHVHDGRVLLSDLQSSNTVTVEATMTYSRDGHGLHRAVDAADGNAYTYALSFLDAAPRIFACFDQPDLKAPYDVSVHAPADWTVLGNGNSEQTGPQDWTLSTTQPLSTYFVTVCAGPFATVRDEHDGIPLTLSARSSQRALLEAQAPQMFEVTKQSFDYFHELYGVRYEFGDYHQVFVPEFNAGAMENPGCVTFNDDMIYRGAISRQQLLKRSNTIAHEMAHMWFGDMVTMQWWDDLWLNESFAEYMSHRCLAEATEFTDAFVDFGIVRKVWGYAADRSPSTHPVAGSPAPDAESALQNFDGISYAKGASVLRQLIAHIGDDAFVAGVRDHISSHLYGNASLSDFIGAMERASGQDLSDWQAAWLGSAGADRISVELTAEAGVITQATGRRTAPADFPAERPHTLDISGFTDGRRVLHVQATIDRAEQDLTELVGQPTPKVLVPNAADLTWATVELDDATLAALPDQLRLIEDGSAREVIWTALLSGLALATIDPRHVLRIFEAAWPSETDASILETVAANLRSTLPRYLPETAHPELERALAAAGRTLLGSATPGGTHALSAARLVAASSADVPELEAWLHNDGLPQGLEGDQSFRWIVASNLARRGALDDAGIDALAAEDLTMDGKMAAIRAKASAPSADAKERVWKQLVSDDSLSNYELVAMAEGFWDVSDVELVRPYVDRYFTEIPPLADRLSGMALGIVAVVAFPSPVVEVGTLERSHSNAERDDLAPFVKRAIIDQGSRLQEALRSRETFASAS